VTLDLEVEITAAKVRLGYGPDDPVSPANLVEQELPAELRAPFWARQIRAWFVAQGIDPDVP
jgi:hypothetical protein